MAGRDRRANTPSQARHFLDSMRGLFRWAVKVRLVNADPTVGVDNLPLPKNDGFAVWPEDDIAAYERRWPIGTRNGCGLTCRCIPACVVAMLCG